MVKICAITVLLVLSVLSIKTADGRKLIPRLLAQKTTCGSFFYNSQVNNDQVNFSYIILLINSHITADLFSCRLLVLFRLILAIC